MNMNKKLCNLNFNETATLTSQSKNGSHNAEHAKHTGLNQLEKADVPYNYMQSC